MRRIFWVVTWLAVLGLVSSMNECCGQDKQELALKAKAFLETHCHRCHGKDGTAEGRMNFVLDREKLIERKKIVPGDAGKSRLFKLVKEGDMPQDDKTTPSEAEIASLKDWINAGAPDFNLAPKAARSFISNEDMLKFILDDLERKVPERERRFARYFTITHLYNAGLSEDELQTYRQGLSKLVNSLSWGRTIVKPLPVDSAQTIFRVDLRKLTWDDKVWNRILAANPYGVTHDTPTAKACYAATACELPYVRADWFVAAASKPPLYHDVLQLPKTDQELERQLKVDVAANIEQENVIRAGFNGSGVSQNNRIIERHESGYGAYWKSYDFASNLGRKNIFSYPLGPGTNQSSFQHDGGEIIFNLPNGLQAYMLVNAKGDRIDVGPTNIVFDKEAGAKGRQPEVVNGISCMSCHYAGMKEKDDQIRSHVLQNQNAFAKKDADTILALYFRKEQFDERLTEDAGRFRRAVEECGGQIGKSEPIVFLVQRFEEELDAKVAAAEAGLRTPTLLDGIGRSQVLARSLGPLKAHNTVKREVFLATFPTIVAELNLGKFYNPSTNETAKPKATPTKVPEKVVGKPLATLQSFQAYNCQGYVYDITFSRDGSRFLVASFKLFRNSKFSAQQFDVSSGQQLKLIEKESHGPCGVAYSNEGPRAFSCDFADNAIHLWNMDTGSEIKSFRGHTDIVNDVVVSPKGDAILSGSSDKSLRLWDIKTGRQLGQYLGFTEKILSVAFSRDGTMILAGGGDDSSEHKGVDMRCWDVNSHKEIQHFAGHTRTIESVAFSSDGSRALSGSLDETARLWDVKTGKELKCFRPQELVHRVNFVGDGRRVLLTCHSSARIYDIDSTEEARFDAELSLGPTAISPDGNRALCAVMTSGRVHLLSLSRK